MTEKITKQQTEDYVTVGTKVSRTTFKHLKRIAKKKGMAVYELLQMVCDTLRRYMDDRHNLSPEIERAMSIFEHMVGWADALNLADPTVNKEIAQAVYIFQDGCDPELPNKERKRGFRAVMVNKPFMGIWEETANVMDIFERIFNICMPELYMKLYRARIILGCERVSEVINLLVDAEVIMQLNGELREDFEDAARAENGKVYEYGKKTRSTHRNSIDDVINNDGELTIQFTEEGELTADEEAEDGR